MSWRLNWALRQFADVSAYPKHAQALRSEASQFYLSILRKLIPGISPGEISLQLKDGGMISVRDFMTLYIYKEIFVDHCYDVAIDRSVPAILDIGANTGLFALRMKQLFPSSRVTCYEPFPPNFEQLERTITRNCLDSVYPVRKAVGVRSGRTKLYVHQRNVGGHSLYSSVASSERYVNVEIVALRAILDHWPGEVDLLKADCEGAEFEILMSLTAAQAERVRQIIIEPMPKLYDVKQLIAHLNSLGYSHRWRQGLFLFARSPNAVAPAASGPA